MNEPYIEIDFESLTNDEFIDRIEEREAAVFVGGKRFGYYEAEGVGAVPAVEIDGLEWLEEKLREGRVTCAYFGIGNELPPGNPIPLFLHFRLNVAPLYIWIEDADEEWKAAALHRVCAIFPPGPDGKRAYLLSGPMKQLPKGTIIPADFNAPKIGRNDPCPCGSGKKNKRCCGA